MQLEDGAWLYVTVHPSYLLRIRDREAAALKRRRFEADRAAARGRAQAASAA